MKEAAGIWAEARIQGMPTADKKSLDADVIICAQYKLLEKEYLGRYIIFCDEYIQSEAFLLLRLALALFGLDCCL